MPVALIAAAVLLVGVSQSARAAEVDHGPWNDLLKQYVDDAGKVAYQRLQVENGAVLKKYLATLGAAKVDDLSEKDQLAFWINAYNAMVVEAVIEGYTAESVLKRQHLFGAYAVELAGKKRSPDDVENDMIRARFHDPRIHFALVGAAMSAPVLRREAYVGVRLDEQLDAQARRFLSDSSRNRIDPQTGTVALSHVFEWSKSDFAADGKTLADTLAPYLTPAQVELLRIKPATFLDYDFTLNAQSGQRP